MIPIIKTVSEQTAEVYKLLSTGRTLRVQEIAKELGVLPNGIYRATDKLVDIGAIETVEGYPVSFRAVPAHTALNLYLTATAQNFKRTLGVTSQTTQPTGTEPKISLIKDRESMLLRSTRDIRKAERSIDFVVSGLMVPDDTYLAYRQAIAKGVKVRAIVQVRHEVGGKRLEQWKELGIAVRYLPDLRLRLLIYDRRITYIASQDPQNQSSGFGIRFEYKPLAEQMTNLFEQNWQKAQEL